MIRVVSAKILNGYTVKLKLSNGSTKTVNLEPFLCGQIFEPLKQNYKLFASLKVDKTLGTIVWENGADIDPDVLLGKNVPERKSDELFSKSFRVTHKKLAVSEGKAIYKLRAKK
ncbi:MAG: DUF2442 domain-containing protein [Bacteroidota bacterium]|nr:DUF2442 domain-containing protein [Bacteroidota bacterium]